MGPLNPLSTTLPLARILDAARDLPGPALDAAGRVAQPVAQRLAHRARRARDRVADAAARGARDAPDGAC